MANRTVIPFGPQHPVLPEPIHLDLVIEDEHVVEAIPSFGFIHRGLEKLVEKKDFTEFTFIAERICGICSYIHGMGYCQAVETVMGLEIPERAKWLRTMWSELSRIHSHMMWLGLLADAFGFENLFMACWRLREGILDVIEETSGGRVIFGAAKVGGCRRDVPDDLLARIPAQLNAVEGELRAITNVFRDDFSVRQRLCGVGLLSKNDAYDLGAVGPCSAPAASHRIPDSMAMRPTTKSPWSPSSKKAATAGAARWSEFARSINPSTSCATCFPTCHRDRWI